MRTAWNAALLALALGACGAPSQNAAAPSAAAAADCNRSAHVIVPFTAADAQDIVEARAIGDDCKNAFVLMTVRKATGEPLWAWATPHPWLHGDDSGAITQAAMDDFLKGWAKVHVDTTASLPDWPERTTFKDDLGPYMHTPLQRDQYVDVRNKALPRLCHAIGLESGLCIYYDASSGVAFEVFQSGV